jgi:hypothetical protein
MSFQPVFRAWRLKSRQYLIAFPESRYRRFSRASGVGDWVAWSEEASEFEREQLNVFVPGRVAKWRGGGVH